MNSLLPNLRLLSLTSDHRGQDYAELCLAIDRELEASGYDLEEECVYIFFENFPDGACLVARPVIGPVKATLTARLWDLSSMPVERKNLSQGSWEGMLTELASLRGQSRKKVCLRLSRRIEDGNLRLTAEGILHD